MRRVLSKIANDENGDLWKRMKISGVMVAEDNLWMRITRLA
jgi:hypothetical protein